MSVLMIFFDGLGLGPDDPGKNPLLTAEMPALRELFDGIMPTRANGRFRSAKASLVPTDATLGVPGLPQSATGQTTIFTGVNAARAIGQHLGPYPNAALRKIIAHENLFQRVTAARRSVAFANAYPPIFFERLARNKARRSATSYAARAAGVRYRNADDLRAGRAVSAFVTNERWPKISPAPGGNAEEDIPVITAREAGRNLARLARERDFTLFEYFLTDAAGHKGSLDVAHHVLREIDQMLRGVLDELDLSSSLVIATSDHGNIEDLSTKRHTLNPVPTLVIGADHASLALRIRSLTDLTPAIVDYLLKR